MHVRSLIAFSGVALLLVGSQAERLSGSPKIHAVPFELVRHQVLLDVHVEGQGPFRMHMDTAVYPSVVDETVAERIELATSGPAGFVAGYGSRQIPYFKATLGSISIGGFQLPELETEVTDMSHLELDGVALRGTLGEAFFRRTWTQIDYPSRTVRLFSEEVGQGAQGPDCSLNGEVLAVDLSGHAPRLLEVEINGRPVTALLDTGASAGLNLSTAQARRLGLEHLWDSAQKVEARGARGSFEARKARVDSVRVGSFEVSDVVTVLTTTPGPILIGNGFLKEFVLTVDYVGGRICLAAPGPGGARPL